MLVESTKKVREPIAFGLLVVAALYLVSALSVLFKSRDDIFLDFAGRAALVGHVFADPVLVIALVGAATLVAAFGQPSRNAKTVVVSALVIGAIALVFLVVSWLAGLSADRITSYGGVSGAGKIVGIFLGLAQIGFLALALFYVVAVYQSLPKPVRAPAWGQSGAYGWGPPPPGWGQQGWDQGQQGWAQGQQGWDQGQQGWDQGQQGWAQQGQQGWAQGQQGWDEGRQGWAQAQQASAHPQPGWDRGEAGSAGQAGQSVQPGQPSGDPAPGPWGPPASAPGWGSSQPETGWATGPAGATADAEVTAGAVESPEPAAPWMPSDTTSSLPSETTSSLPSATDATEAAATPSGSVQAAHRDDSAEVRVGPDEPTTAVPAADAVAGLSPSADEASTYDEAAPGDETADTTDDDDDGTRTDDSGWWRPSSS